jgi:hypothetical protein
MSASISLMRTWVIETLSGLADDDDHARLHETLGVFLQENGSCKASSSYRRSDMSLADVGDAELRLIFEAHPNSCITIPPQRWSA